MFGNPKICPVNAQFWPNIVRLPGRYFDPWGEQGEIETEGGGDGNKGKWCTLTEKVAGTKRKWGREEACLYKLTFVEWREFPSGIRKRFFRNVTPPVFCISNIRSDGITQSCVHFSLTEYLTSFITNNWYSCHGNHFLKQRRFRKPVPGLSVNDVGPLFWRCPGRDCNSSRLWIKWLRG